jgi:hypothetical protein
MCNSITLYNALPGSVRPCPETPTLEDIVVTRQLGCFTSRKNLIEVIDACLDIVDEEYFSLFGDETSQIEEESYGTHRQSTPEKNEDDPTTSNHRNERGESPQQ